MKKSLIAVFGAMLATAACADYVLSFSTPGPDKYADGNTVLDGEKYALVWTPTGSEFAGFNVDGTAKGDSKVAIAAPVAKGGKCPMVLFAVTDDALTAFPGGTWGVYLLDTRVFPVNEKGEITGNPTIGGSAKGYGTVAASTGTGFVSVKPSSAITASAITSAELKITNIGFEEDNVLLTVQGAAGKFKIFGGDDLAAGAQIGGDRASESDEAVVILPKKANGEFFKVSK